MIKDSIKSLKGWHSSGLSLTKYLQVDDEVSSDLKNYFLEVLPPAHWDADLIQIGEAHGSDSNGLTFVTLVRRKTKWFYAGTCHLGKSQAVN